MAFPASHFAPNLFDEMAKLNKEQTSFDNKSSSEAIPSSMAISKDSGVLSGSGGTGEGGLALCKKCPGLFTSILHTSVSFCDGQGCKILTTFDQI